MPEENKEQKSKPSAENQPKASEEDGAGAAEAQEGTAGAAPTPTAEEIAELQKKAAERDDFLDKLQRTRADYLNYQKRVRKEREQAAELAVQDFLVQLAPLITDLERAIQSEESSRDLTAFFGGIKILSAQFQKILKDYGVKPIATVGKRFDPMYHEAVMQQETTEYPEGTIIAELQRGFTMNDRTIVPARVSVAKPPKPEEPESEDTEGKEAEETKEGEGKDADV